MPEKIVFRKIAICGASGFIGKSLTKDYLENKVDVFHITRAVLKLPEQELADKLHGCEVIFNFAGAPITKRWTPVYKKEIINSRVSVTSKIVGAIALMKVKPLKLINASAIGIYDYVHTHDESSTNYGTTFLSEVVKEWEDTAHKLDKISGVDLVIARIGLVFGRDGGVIPKMGNLFQKGLASKVGSGSQPVSFIQLQDLLHALRFVAERKESTGVYNMVAPSISTNSRFSSVLAEIHKTKVRFTLPVFVLKLFMGESSILLTKGEKVKPKRLLEEGYTFICPDLLNAVFYSLK